MTLPLDHESRIPLRAAVAVSLALAIGGLGDPQLRWYWAVLVAAVLVSGTFGEGTRRGMTRFAMTAVGAAAGWDLHHLIGHTAAARIAIMLFGIFWAVYFRGASYAWFVFFITVYIVSLFDVLEKPADQIVVIRIFQTFIGCGLALAASFFVPMPRAADQWESDRAEFLRCCQEIVNQAFDRIGQSAATAENAAGNPSRRQTGIIARFEKLRADCQAAVYETMNKPAERRRRKAFMESAWGLMRAVLCLDHAATAGVDPSAASWLADDLAAARASIAACLEKPDTACADLLDRCRSKLLDGQRSGTISAADFQTLEAVCRHSSDIIAACA